MCGQLHALQKPLIMSGFCFDLATHFILSKMNEVRGVPGMKYETY